MGLTNWLNRPMRGHRLGVSDLTTGDEGVPVSKRRKWALQTIDSAPFQVWVVVVAGIGFLTDAFGLFSLNVVTPMIGYVYWPNNTTGGVPEIPPGVKTAMLCATLAGTMIGQVAFGIAADFLGRRKMYGMELVIVIVGTMLMIMSSNGEKNSMKVEGWLIAWRAIMGLGIGADYPLSAVITAEFAPKRFRARMLSWVFFMQPVGQLLANVLSLAAVQGFKSQITDQRLSCGDNDLKCFRAIDRLWRLVVGIGIVPAVIALVFRFTIPESPRYKLDVLRNVQTVFEDTKDYYGAPELNPEGGELDILPTSPVINHHVMPNGGAPSRRSSTSEITLDEVIDSDNEDSQSVHASNHPLPQPPVQLPPGDPNFVPPLASWADAKQFFITEGNWLYLLGTSLSWFFLDVAFYGLGLSSPTIVRHIWAKDAAARDNVFTALRNNSQRTLALVTAGACIGGAIMIKVIKYASPKVIQFWGFLALFVLFIVTGSVWRTLLGAGHSWLILLYILIQIAFNLGPNVTTFIIPAEIFPTRYRCTCHGIAAASGKLGSWIVQIALAYGIEDDEKKERENFGFALLGMSVLMMAGAVTTYFMVPETRDHDNRSRTLEVLGGGRRVLEKLNRERERAREED